MLQNLPNLTKISYSKRLITLCQINFVLILSIIFIINIILPSTAFSNIKKLKLDSVTHYNNNFNYVQKFEYDENNKISRYLYEFQSEFQNYIVSEIKFKYDDNDNIIYYEKWQNFNDYLLPENKYEKAYDSKNNEILDITYKLDILKSEWIPNTKTETQYNNQNKIIKNENFTWSQNQNKWILKTSELRDFINDTLLTKYQKYDLDSINNKLILTKIDNRIYDDKLNLLEFSSYTYYEAKDTLIGFNNTKYTYNENGVITNKLQYNWDLEKMEWFLNDETKNYFENNLLVKKEIYKFNPFFGKLMNNFEYNYLYNNQNKLISEECQIFDNIEEKWVNYSQIFFEYDNIGRKILDEFYEWDKNNNSWIGVSKFLIEYLTDNERNYIKTEYIWEEMKSEWIEDAKYEIEIDERGYKIAEAIYLWDLNDSNWYGVSKYISIYEAAINKYTYETYNWDWGINSWKGEQKYETYYHKNNQFLKRYEYEEYDLDKGWILNKLGENIYDDNNNLIFVLNNIKDNNSDKLILNSKIENVFDYDILRNEVILPKSLNIQDHNIRTKTLSHSTSLDNPKDPKVTIQYHYSTINTSVKNDIDVNPDISIYPNPSTERITLDLIGIEFADLLVYDILGNEIISIPNYTNKSEIDISNLSIGTYIIQVQTKTGSSSQRFVKY